MRHASQFAFATRCIVTCLMASAAIGAELAAQPSTTSAPAATSAAIGFAGEVRTRSEWDRPGGTVPSDLFTFLRTRFGAYVDAAPGVRLVLQVQDSRVLGAEGNPASAVVEEFGLHQAYVELRGRRRNTQLALRAGRQEIVIGNERLVGVVGWSNIGRSFDGARLTVTHDDSTLGRHAWNATAFAATVEERGRHYGAGAVRPQQDHVLAGLAAALALPRGASLDATALYDAGGNYRGFSRANRATFDVRMRAPLFQHVAVEIESAWQTGHQRDRIDSSSTRTQTVNGWMAGMRAGAFAASGRRTSLVIGGDVLSGDAHPHDGRYEAFSTMYGSNHAFYGLMDAIGDPSASTRERGLVDLLANGSISLSTHLALRGEAHRFLLASGTGRDLGWEADVIMPVRVLPTATVDLGFSAFRAGRNAADVGLGAVGTVRDWAFIQLRVGF